MKNLSPKAKKFLIIGLIIAGIVLIYYFLKGKTSPAVSTDTAGTSGTPSGTTTIASGSPKSWAEGSPYGSQSDMDSTYNKYAAMDKESAIAEFIESIKRDSNWYQNIVSSVPADGTIEKSLRDAATYMLWVAGVPGF